MLTIGRLSLRLPPGFEHRAVEIARLLADGLADVSPAAAGTFDRLQIEHVLPRPDASDRAIAGAIALHVHRTLGRQNAAGGDGGDLERC